MGPTRVCNNGTSGETFSSVRGRLLFKTNDLNATPIDVVRVPARHTEEKTEKDDWTPRYAKESSTTFRRAKY